MEEGDVEVDKELDVEVELLLVVELLLLVELMEVLDTVDEVTVDDAPVYPQTEAVQATPASAGAT